MSDTKFWGLVASGGKQYVQKVEETIVITQAELVDNAKQGGKSNNTQGELVKVVAKVDGTDYVICQLTPENRSSRMQVTLSAGRKVDIVIDGSQKWQVHLIGHISGDGIVSVPSKVSNASSGVTKLKAANAAKAEKKTQEAEVSVALKNKQAEPVMGKKKKLVAQQEVNMDDDDDDDDEDDINDMLEFESSDEEDDDLEAEEEDTGADFGKAKLTSMKLSALQGKPGVSSKKNFNFDDDEDEEDDDDEDDDEEDDDEDEEEISVVKSGKNKKNPDVAKNGKSKSLVPAGLQTPLGKVKKAVSESPAGMVRKVFTKGGVIVEDLKMGDGIVAKAGKMVSVYYMGKLKSNNKVFDKNLKGKGFRFRLGKGEVIKGWDLGVEGMKIGGKRKLTVPSGLAYGSSGAPPDIPPNSTLVFEVELKNVS